MLELLREVAAGEGRTVVMVTHDERAAAFGHHTVRLSDGRLDGG